MAKITTEQFILKSINVYGDKYIYDKVKYTRTDKKVVITYPTHGDFEQTPNSHLQGSNCPKCASEFRKGGYSQEYFDLQPKVKDELGQLYIVELFNDEEKFIKVGITSQSIT